MTVYITITAKIRSVSGSHVVASTAIDREKLVWNIHDAGDFPVNKSVPDGALLDITIADEKSVWRYVPAISQPTLWEKLTRWLKPK